MRVVELRVRGYRCLRTLDLPLDALTAVIGANGTGKSSVIRALEFLFGQAPGNNLDVTEGSADPEFEVQAVLGGLDGAEKTVLGPWLAADGSVTVGRRWTGDGSGDGTGGSSSWFATRRAVGAFCAVRAATSAADAKAGYKQAREDSRYADLPAWANRADALAALDDWEQTYPDADRQEVEDPGLRFDSGGAVDLRQHLDLLVVPAVRDPAVDAGEAKGSNLGRLTDVVVHSRLDLGDRLADLGRRADAEYQQIVQDGAGAALAALQQTVSDQLNALAPGTSVRLDWHTQPPSLGRPTVRARLVESGHADDIGRQGHGVQRAYVFALLRALVGARSAEAAGERDGDAPLATGPSLLLVVEEPELYQHPLRSRYLSRTLEEFAGAGSQVLYATHSPYFTGVERLPAVRLFRMHTDPDGVAVTRHAAFDADAAVGRLNAAAAGTGTPWTVTRLHARLASLSETPVGEGLFARAVLLVEGDEDRGLLLGADQAAGGDLTADGIAVVPVNGKTNLDRALVLFEQLGVPAYTVFDADNQHDDANNRRRNAVLTRLLTGAPQETPSGGAAATWACADTTLLAQVGQELGQERLAAAIAAAADDLGLDHDRADKNGLVVRRAVVALAAGGRHSPTLEGIISAARALAG